jgi:uncharacterized Zn-binding protein involved in type VI secretion
VTRNVFANLWEIAAKSGMNKSIARFPDVCLSPPSPPAGPIPVPYPDTSFSTDLKNGSTTVRIGGKPVALAQKSYYKPSLLGDEAATRTFGANVITHQITGKSYFQAWSMDVKIEGKNVCRHFDITTSNHSSPPPATPPLPSAEMMAMPAQQAIDEGKCPCCGEALHPYQKGDDGAALKPISERDYYEKKIKAREDAERAKLPAAPKVEAKINARLAALAEKRKDIDKLIALKEASRQKVADAKAAGNSPAEAAKAGCLNVNEKDGQGCGTYFDTQDVRYTTNPVRIGASDQIVLDTVSKLSKADFSSTQYLAKIGKSKTDPTPKDIAIQKWEEANPPRKVAADDKMDHKTPKQAGGCNSAYNTAPRTWYSDPADKTDPCTQIEDLQSSLETL